MWYLYISLLNYFKEVLSNEKKGRWKNACIVSSLLEMEKLKTNLYGKIMITRGRKCSGEYGDRYISFNIIFCCRMGNTRDRTIALISHATKDMLQNSPSQASAIYEPWTSVFKLVLEKARNQMGSILKKFFSEDLRCLQCNKLICQ